MAMRGGGVLLALLAAACSLPLATTATGRADSEAPAPRPHIVFVMVRLAPRAARCSAAPPTR
eukprot:COSAG04_NODE_10544_length_770_cov_0.543964_1_plen_62_part_00